MSSTKTGRVTQPSRYQFTPADCRKGGAVLRQRAIEHLPATIRTQALLLFEAGKSYGEIARRLNALGLTTQRGKQFRRETVKRLIGRMVTLSADANKSDC